MSDPVYIIRDWQRVFAYAAADKHDVVLWRRHPIKHSTTYRELMLTSEGRTAYCVWCAILDTCASQKTNGKLHTGRRPINAAFITVATGIPLAETNSAMALLADPQIGWLIPFANDESTFDRRLIDEQSTDDRRIVDFKSTDDRQMIDVSSIQNRPRAEQNRAEQNYSVIQKQSIIPPARLVDSTQHAPLCSEEIPKDIRPAPLCSDNANDAWTWGQVRASLASVGIDAVSVEALIAKTQQSQPNANWKAMLMQGAAQAKQAIDRKRSIGSVAQYVLVAGGIVDSVKVKTAKARANIAQQVAQHKQQEGAA